MLRKLSELVFGKQLTRSVGNWTMPVTKQQLLYRLSKKYIAREAAVGARLLGPLPSGHQREFFCLDRHTWIWHESWRDQHNQLQEFTVNYEIDPSGVLKRVNSGSYSLLQGEELARFEQAVRAYYQEVSRQVYDHQVAPAR